MWSHGRQAPPVMAGGMISIDAATLHGEGSPSSELGDDAIAGPSAHAQHKADLHQMCHGRRGWTPHKAAGSWNGWREDVTVERCGGARAWCGCWERDGCSYCQASCCCSSVVAAASIFANDYCLGWMQLQNQAKTMRQQVAATAAAAGAVQQLAEGGETAAANCTAAAPAR
jgi:hypothetical protein